MDSGFAIIGATALAGAGLCAKTLSQLFWLSRYGQSAKGSVVYEEEQVVKGGTSYKPVVQFTDECGTSQQFRSRSSNRFSKLGRQVTVKYDSADPEKRPEIAEESKSLILQFLIFTAICFALSIFMFILAGRSR